MPSEPKQLLYIYNGDQSKLDDVQVDVTGEMRVPEKHEVLERARKQVGKWFQITTVTATDGRLPVYQVYLKTYTVPERI